MQAALAYPLWSFSFSLSALAFKLFFIINEETPAVVTARVLVKRRLRLLRFGTDLLSHVLPQYHRLWWA